MATTARRQFRKVGKFDCISRQTDILQHPVIELKESLTCLNAAEARHQTLDVLRNKTEILFRAAGQQRDGFSCGHSFVPTLIFHPQGNLGGLKLRGRLLPAELALGIEP